MLKRRDMGVFQCHEHKCLLVATDFSSPPLIYEGLFPEKYLFVLTD